MSSSLLLILILWQYFRLDGLILFVIAGFEHFEFGNTTMCSPHIFDLF